MNLVDRIEAAYQTKKVTPFRPGDTVRVFAKIKEGDKERLQPFEGIVLRTRGGGTRTTVTVRKISYGVGVERIFPLYSPTIDRIEVVSKGKARRARLYYLRKLKGRKAKMETEEYFGPEVLEKKVPQGESKGGETLPAKAAKSAKV